MKLDTNYIWNEYKDELYFFTLKRVKDEESAQEILQNAFLKIHQHLHTLVADSKVRAWAYRILRNEIADFRRRTPLLQYESSLPQGSSEASKAMDPYCCFERFLEALPEPYRAVVQEVYLEGKTQQKAAEALGLSLANTKARIRHAKALLKEKFQECCNYELNAKGLLTGEPDCSACAATS